MATKESSPAAPASPPDEPLPAGFSSIKHILGLPNDVIKSNAEFNIFGVLKDFQPPIATRGNDMKCTIEVTDHSIRGDAHGIKMNIFWPLEKVPTNVNVADIVLIRRAKVQMWSGSVSLLASHLSELHFLGSASVPRTTKEMKTAPWVSYTRKQKSGPTVSETQYAAWLNSKNEELDLPSDTEFKMKMERSLNVGAKDKFRLQKELKETIPHSYATLIGQVIKLHDNGGDMLELYFSDYTSNPGFFNYVWGAGLDDTDEYGYVKPQAKAKKSNEWPGPFGKLTIQIALWDPHASYAREVVKVGQWVQLSNVKIKTGSSGFLEGVIHYDDRVKITILKPNKEGVTSESSPNEVRLHEAIAQKFNFEKRFAEQLRAIGDETAALGDKRKRGREEDDVLQKPGKSLTSKQKRKLQRAVAVKEAEEAKLKKLKLGNLNQNIRCNFPEKETTSIKEILKPVDLGLENSKVNAPFTIAKYRANVRVVDYFPHIIEDFAVGWRTSEFDSLEDFSGLEDTDVERSQKTWQSGHGHPKDQWEWRFALQVEDAEPEVAGSNDKMWLIVDNASAEMLFNLSDDATSLRADKELLGQVKEQLFKLWGDLEERKSATLHPKRTAKKSAKPIFSSIDSDLIPSSPPPRLGIMPTSTDSDDENAQLPPLSNASKGKFMRTVLEERVLNGTNIVGGGEHGQLPILETKNKGFGCCIRQYGVKVREDDPEKANAGEGRRWQRMFGLFGTMID